VGKPTDIDALYGLEPVFEPGDGAAPGTPGGTEFHGVQCPYCGEPFETLIDLSGGSSTYVEDCQVCCQPIEFRVTVDHAGALVTLETVRSD
jgi:Cysteine-rich CPXCG